MAELRRLQILGGGRMGSALLAGLLDSSLFEPQDICVVEVDASRRAELERLHEGVHATEIPVPADGTVVAVKPNDVESALRAAVAAGTRRVLSLAAGVRLATLEAICGDIPVIRAMPNTPALVRKGAAAISRGRSATDEDMAWAERILGSVGMVVRVPETAMDAVTALSGSGPAYVFLLLEALVEAGVQCGLTREVSRCLAEQTLLGAAHLVVETQRSPVELRWDVTSPGGTTAAALAELERRGFRSAVMDAVRLAAERSATLGGAGGRGADSNG